MSGLPDEMGFAMHFIEHINTELYQKPESGIKVSEGVISKNRFGDFCRPWSKRLIALEAILKKISLFHPGQCALGGLLFVADSLHGCGCQCKICFQNLVS